MQSSRSGDRNHDEDASLSGNEAPVEGEDPQGGVQGRRPPSERERTGQPTGHLPAHRAQGHGATHGGGVDRALPGQGDFRREAQRGLAARNADGGADLLGSERAADPAHRGGRLGLPQGPAHGAAPPRQRPQHGPRGGASRRPRGSRRGRRACLAACPAGEPGSRGAASRPGTARRSPGPRLPFRIGPIESYRKKGTVVDVVSIPYRSD